MNTQKVVSEAWRTQMNHMRTVNHVLLPGFPPLVTTSGHVMEEMPSISKPASQMLLGTASDFPLLVAVVPTDFLETPKRNCGYSIPHSFWNPAYLKL